MRCPHHPPGEGCSLCPQDEAIKRISEAKKQKKVKYDENGWIIHDECPRDKSHGRSKFDSKKLNLFWCRYCKCEFCTTCDKGVVNRVCPSCGAGAFLSFQKKRERVDVIHVK